MTLSAAEHFEWLALRRVNRGGMTRSGTGFVDFGQPLVARVWHTDAGPKPDAQLCRTQRRAASQSTG